MILEHVLPILEWELPGGCFICFSQTPFHHQDLHPVICHRRLRRRRDRRDRFSNWTPRFSTALTAIIALAMGNPDKSRKTSPPPPNPPKKNKEVLSRLKKRKIIASSVFLAATFHFRSEQSEQQVNQLQSEQMWMYRKPKIKVSETNPGTLFCWDSIFPDNGTWPHCSIQSAWNTWPQPRVLTLSCPRQITAGHGWIRVKLVHWYIFASEYTSFRCPFSWKVPCT